MKNTKVPKGKQMVRTRRKDLRKITNQLRKISKEERTRVSQLWDMHKELFSNPPEEKEKEKEPTTIDEYFEE